MMLYDPIKTKDMPRIVLRVEHMKPHTFVAAFKSGPLAMMAHNKKPAEVILWGERAFIFKGYETIDGREDVIYEEGLMYPLQDGATGEQDQEYWKKYIDPLNK